MKQMYLQPEVDTFVLATEKSVLNNLSVNMTVADGDGDFDDE